MTTGVKVTPACLAFTIISPQLGDLLGLLGSACRRNGYWPYGLSLWLSVAC